MVVPSIPESERSVFTKGGPTHIFAALLAAFKSHRGVLRKAESVYSTNWQSYEDHPNQRFDSFLQWCIDIVGAKKQNAEGNFRNTGLRLKKHKVDTVRDTGSLFVFCC